MRDVATRFLFGRGRWLATICGLVSPVRYVRCPVFGVQHSAIDFTHSVHMPIFIARSRHSSWFVFWNFTINMFHFCSLFFVKSYLFFNQVASSHFSNRPPNNGDVNAANCRRLNTSEAYMGVPPESDFDTEGIGKDVAMGLMSVCDSVFHGQGDWKKQREVLITVKTEQKTIEPLFLKKTLGWLNLKFEYVSGKQTTNQWFPEWNSTSRWPNEHNSRRFYLKATPLVLGVFIFCWWFHGFGVISLNTLLNKPECPSNNPMVSCFWDGTKNLIAC